MTPVTDRTDSRHVNARSSAKWGIVALLWVAYFLNQADRQIFGVTLVRIQAEFGLSNQQMGLVATTFTVVFGMLVPFAGIAGDRYPRRYIVVASLLLFSVGTLFTGAVSSFLPLLLLRGVATGAGEAFYQPAASALIAERHVETRARALSVHQTANYIGVVFGSLFAGWIADHYGWRHAFAAFGAAGLCWALVILTTARRQEHHIAPATRPAISTGLAEALRVIVAQPMLLGQIIGFSALVFVLVGYLTWMPAILYERFGLSLASAGFSAVAYHHAMAALGLAIGSAATDRLTPRLPRVRPFLMAASLILFGPFIWISADAHSLGIVYLGLALFGLFRGFYDANLFAAIYDLVDDRLRATVTGLIVAVAYLVGAMSPLYMGYLQDRYGPAASLHMLALAAMVAGAIFLILVVTTSRHLAQTKRR